MHMLLALMLAAAPAARSTSSSAYDALRARATEQYRAKHFAEACKGFEDASTLKPSDGANWADLGLCLEKLGRREDASAAEGKAAQGGDATARLHAYFNLSKLGAARPLPANVLAGLTRKLRQGCPKCAEGVDAGSGEACTSWLADVPAGTQVFVCPYDAVTGGTGGTSKEAGVAFCTTLAAAKAFDPYAGSTACMHVPLVEVEQSFCRPGDVGGATCGACGCDTAKDPDACEKKVEACQQHANDETDRSCSIAFVDASAGRIGAVCSERANGGKPGPSSAKELGR